MACVIGTGDVSACGFEAIQAVSFPEVQIPQVVGSTLAGDSAQSMSNTAISYSSASAMRSTLTGTPDANATSYVSTSNMSPSFYCTGVKVVTVTSTHHHYHNSTCNDGGRHNMTATGHGHHHHNSIHTGGQLTT